MVHLRMTMLASSPTIAVIGTGALGGFYGGLLARSGQRVHFLVRSDFEQVARHGLRVDSVDGDFVIERVNAHDSADTMPRCSIALVCLKSTDNEVLTRLIPRVLEPGGTIVLLQNGLGEEERLAEIDRAANIVSALGFVCATKVGPGHVKHLDYGSIRIAHYRANQGRAGITPTLTSLAELLERAGIAVALAEDWLEARWKKLVWNVPFNGLSVVLRADTGQLVGHAPTRELVRELMLEVTAAAAAEGRAIADTFVDRMIADTARMRPYLPSMRIDYDSGRALETPAMYRTPLARGTVAGVAMPRTATLAAQLEFLATSRHAGGPPH